jgi:hypothetical protein
LPPLPDTWSTKSMRLHRDRCVACGANNVAQTRDENHLLLVCNVCGTISASQSERNHFRIRRPACSRPHVNGRDLWYEIRASQQLFNPIREVCPDLTSLNLLEIGEHDQGLVAVSAAGLFRSSAYAGRNYQEVVTWLREYALETLVTVAPDPIAVSSPIDVLVCWHSLQFFHNPRSFFASFLEHQPRLKVICVQVPSYRSERLGWLVATFFSQPGLESLFSEFGFRKITGESDPNLHAATFFGVRPQQSADGRSTRVA